MGASTSTDGAGARARVNENVNPLSGLGVATLVREVGMNLIPVHLRHTLDSMMTILDTVAKLRQFDQAPYTSHTVMLVALLRHVQMEDTGGSTPEFDVSRLDFPSRTRTSSTSSSDLEALQQFKQDKRFGIFATNIYFSSLQLTQSQIARNMEVDPENIIFSWLADDNEEHCPKFMIILDHESASVVLVIRGTFSFKDVVMDVVCEDSEFLDGFAHSGFLDGSRMVLNKCSSILETCLRDNFGYSLVVAGHSMGGSVAMMITMELIRTDSFNILPPGVTVRCVALGPAPVYRTVGATPRVFRDNIHIYVNDRDVVPRLSLGSVAKALMALREIDSLGLRLEEQLAVVMWRRDMETVTNRTRVRSVVSEVCQDKFQFLYHPGTVFRVVSSESRTRANVVMDSLEDTDDMAENLEIFETMVSDHIHTSYRENFNKIHC